MVNASFVDVPRQRNSREDDIILYADSAYRSAKIQEYLEAKQCKSNVHKKGYRNNPLNLGYFFSGF